MNIYEDDINTMHEKAEGRKAKLEYQLTDTEKLRELIAEYGHSNYIVQTEYGIVDMNDDAMKDVRGGENLTYDEYVKTVLDSRNIRRTSFEYCYYNNALCSFKGQISEFDRKKGKVIFNRIYLSAMLMDGNGYEGKEDHVWMDIEPFRDYSEGDCLQFAGEIYRYLKTKHGKQISFGICKPYDIIKIDLYELSNDDEMLMQAIDQIICEACKFNEHCYMGNCIADEKWRNDMRINLYEAAQSTK